MQAPARLERFADRLSGHLEKNKPGFLLGFSILYLPGYCAFAAMQLMWFDEVITLHLARLPGAGDLWAALAAGTDLSPPLFHLMVRWLSAVLGAGPVAIRLPAILGLWILCLSLFLFVARRAPAVYAAVAAMFPLLTQAEYYATEARPYGIVAGCAGLALLAWQSAVEGRRRRRSLAALAFSIALGVCSHYYAVLLLVPIGLGELVRSRDARRLDAPVWMAMLAGLIPLSFHFPLLRVSASYAGSAWSTPSLFQIYEFYRELLQPTIFPGLLIFLLVAVNRLGRSEAPTETAGDEARRLPRHELAAVLGLALLPLVAVLVALLVTGVFVTRYGTPAVAGLAAAFGLLLHRIDGSRPVAGVVCLAVFFVEFAGLAVLRGNLSLRLWAKGAVPFQAPAMLQAPPDDRSPIVIQDPLQFLPLSYYAASELASRLYYVSDVGEAHRYTKSSSADRNLAALARWAPVQVSRYDTFVAAHDRFWLYWRPSNFGWLLGKLSDDGARLEVRQRSGQDILFSVTRGSGAATPASGSAK